jgi:imidazolonepropionase-like amidohydrolase
MRRLSVFCSCLLLLSACGGGDSPPAAGTPQVEPQASVAAGADQAPGPFAGYTVFTGATLWDGTGGRAQRDAALLVRDGRIVEMPADGDVSGAEVVNLIGRFIIPGFVNAHGHVSGRWADDSIVDVADRIRGDLALYARYGTTTVNSLGGEPAESLEVRRDQDDAELDHARFSFAGEVVADTDPQAASATTARNISAGVDWIKLRVDDNLGNAEKMPWDSVQAVFDSANAAGKPVATHIFYMEDAARLLDMGTDMVAHSVRDQRVDDEFVTKMLDSGVCYVPTLTREMSTFVYAGRPDYFSDPFFLEAAKQSEIERVSDPQFMARVANNPATAAYRTALTQALENLRILIGSGVPIAFGTDSGPPGRFPGYFGHVEFYLMSEAGLTSREILLSATSAAAQCLGLTDVGTLEAGKWADFIVLHDDPLRDIVATRTIQDVYIAGKAIQR